MSSKSNNSLPKPKIKKVVSPVEDACIILQNLHDKLCQADAADDKAVDSLVDRIVQLLGEMACLDTRIDDAIGAMSVQTASLPFELPEFDWNTEMDILDRRMFAGPNAVHLGIHAQTQGFDAEIETRVQAARDELMQTGGPSLSRDEIRNNVIDAMDREIELSIQRTERYMALVKAKKERSKAKVLMMAEHILAYVEKFVEEGLPPAYTENLSLTKMRHASTVTDGEAVENIWFTLWQQTRFPEAVLYSSPGLLVDYRASLLSALYRSLRCAVIIYDFGADFQGPPSVLISTPYGDPDLIEDLPAWSQQILESDVGDMS
ncbi:hypothetical protein C8J56DRAFT_885739 [Mycena floridula]|nr:hypothetical protein C8J56DRAFT_885739 [Mycena floridula]